jgi:hypothetical protein
VRRHFHFVTLLIVEAGVKNDQSLLRVLSIAKECIQNKQNKTKQYPEPLDINFAWH